jgi:hypothetical protein
MPKRTVKTALATYVNAKGVAGCIGFQGEEVDVHSDDVERFDELNVQPGGDEPYEEPRASVNMLTSPGAENSGTDSGLNTAVSEDDVAESTAGDDTGESKPRARRSK